MYLQVKNTFKSNHHTSKHTTLPNTTGNIYMFFDTHKLQP